MRKITLLILILSKLVILAEDLKENKYYTLGKVEVLASNPCYPVVNMISAFKNEDVEKAKEFCTDEYIKDVDRYTSEKFKGDGIKDYVKILNPKGWVKFKYFAETEGKHEIYVAFQTKSGATATRSYFVKKINEKWLLVAPKRD